MRKMKDITYNKDTEMLCVFVAGVNEKGARAKGQKFLKLNGVYDGIMWFKQKETVENGTIFQFQLDSPSLTVKNWVKAASRGIRL